MSLRTRVKDLEVEVKKLDYKHGDVLLLITKAFQSQVEEDLVMQVLSKMNLPVTWFMLPDQFTIENLRDHLEYVSDEDLAKIGLMRIPPSREDETKSMLQGGQ